MTHFNIASVFARSQNNALNAAIESNTLKEGNTSSLHCFKLQCVVVTLSVLFSVYQDTCTVSNKTTLVLLIHLQQNTAHTFLYTCIHDSEILSYITLQT